MQINYMSDGKRVYRVTTDRQLIATAASERWAERIAYVLQQRGEA